MLHGYFTEDAYRVSDTYQIRIRVRYAQDTYPPSICFFIIFVMIGYAIGHVSCLLIRPSPVNNPSSALDALEKNESTGRAEKGRGSEEQIDRVADAARSAARIRDIPVRRSRLRAPSSPIRLTGTAAPLSAPSCLSHCRRFAWPSEPLPSASTTDSPEAARRYLAPHAAAAALSCSRRAPRLA